MSTEERTGSVEAPVRADQPEVASVVETEAVVQETSAPAVGLPEIGATAEEGSADEPAGDVAAAAAEDGADETATDEGEAKKKKRRRRRKKKKGDTEPAEGAEAADADGRKAARPAPHGSKAKKAERPAFAVGDEVFGRVAKVTDAALWIDVAGKAVALFDRAELIQVPPRPGEQFIAKVKSFSTRGGMLMLGRELDDMAQTKLELRTALEAQNPIKCWVTGVVKGGIEVDYRGVRAFAPASHVDINPSADLTPLLGEQLEVWVTQYGKKGRDVVVSRKEIIEKEHNEKRAVELAKLEPDMTCKARVRNVVSWGAFVTLPEYGDVEGVIHMSEASHDRGARLGQVLRAGSEIEVKVLRVDDKGKLWLSRKAATEDPWDHVAERYPAGSIHLGKVVRLTDFGAFVQLEAGVDGLCHVADLSFNHIEHPNEVVTEGDDIEVLVAHVDRDKHKVTLHPAPPEGERELPRERVQLYARVQVVVTQIKERGLAVRIVGATGRQARGFIPAAQTGTGKGTDLRKEFPLGSQFEAKIIEIDRRGGEARLSIKALKSDEEKKAYRDYRKQVQREATFGTFGDLFKKLQS